MAYWLFKSIAAVLAALDVTMGAQPGQPFLFSYPPLPRMPTFPMAAIPSTVIQAPFPHLKGRTFGAATMPSVSHWLEMSARRFHPLISLILRGD
jgi:hypothetical protein